MITWYSNQRDSSSSRLSICFSCFASLITWVAHVHWAPILSDRRKEFPSSMKLFVTLCMMKPPWWRENWNAEGNPLDLLPQKSGFLDAGGQSARVDEFNLKHFSKIFPGFAMLTNLQTLCTFVWVLQPFWFISPEFSRELLLFSWNRIYKVLKSFGKKNQWKSFSPRVLTTRRCPP